MINKKHKKDIPLEVIERWFKDEGWHMRAAAINAYTGRDIPLEIIERGLNDKDWRVRAAAMTACTERGTPISVIRTIQPSETVYKKCAGSVIVCAQIPDNAQIRGDMSQKYRANAAIITNVIGDYYGEPVGISTYDKTTTYYMGDEVYVDDFDPNNEECSTGFHFFCTIEEAQNY